MSIDFERPALLLLLPLSLAVVYWLWRTSKAYMPPLRRRVALAVRVAVVTLLCLGLASPLVQLRADELAVAFLVDRSDSISPAARVEQERWLARALQTKSLGDRAAVITFGQEATVEQALSTDATPPRLNAASGNNVDGTRTNIASAIRAGVAALPPSAARRLVLLSDGRENLEQAEPAAALAAAAGVQLLSVPSGFAADTPEVLVRQVDAPAQVREGERFNVTAQVDSTVPTTAALNLLVDGQLAGTQEVSLDSGTNRFVMVTEPLKTGNHVVRVQVEPDVDTLSQNNIAGALVVVNGPARVLVVEGTPGDAQYLAEALRANGLRVDVASPASAPLDLSMLRGYAGAVLANVPASALGAQQMQAIRTYVQSFGGGLVVAGGENAFGPGGYARTPLEDMLPVRMDLRGRSVSASTALMLVMDTSGSMGGGPGGASKMDLSKEAAISAAELLGEYDQIGIVAFEDQPRWVIQPTFASDLGAIQQAIGEMQPGGGTEIYSALKMAVDGLAPLDAKVKHIILLTDGQAPQGDYPGLTRQMRDANISLSTIAIGGDADFRLLEDLARQGNGRYYEGNDPFDLPRLVVKETQQVQRAAIVEEEFRPIRIAAGAAIAGFDPATLPLLRGYVATTPKPQSTVMLVSRQLDPVLTEWQYGLGRVIAWTSDVRNRWSSRWIEWPDFGRFWAQVVKRTARPPDDPNRQVGIKIEGNQARITLDAQTGVEAAERRYLNFLPTSASLVDPRGIETKLPMPQVGPGRYETTVPVQDEGVYLVQVQQTDPATGDVASQSGGVVVPYSPEYRAGGVTESGLEALAKRTGGKLIRDAAQVFVHDLPSVGAPRPLWPTLLVLAALLFVLDVGVRRVRVTGPEMRGAYYAVRRRLGFQDSLTPGAAAPMVRAPARVPVAASLIGSGPVPQAKAASTVRDPRSLSRGNRLLAAKQRAARR